MFLRLYSGNACLTLNEAVAPQHSYLIQDNHIILGRIILITQEVIEYRRWIKDIYSTHTSHWQFESNLAAAMYASFNSSNSNPFNNLSSKVGFSSDKRSFNLNSYNNQIINSFLQQQNNNKSQQQQAPFIQGFPLASANLFPTSFFSLDQNMNEPNFNNNNNRIQRPVCPLY